MIHITRTAQPPELAPRLQQATKEVLRTLRVKQQDVRFVFMRQSRLWKEARPVLEHMFATWPEWDKNGDMKMPTGPGHGIAFHPDARGKYLVKD